MSNAAVPNGSVEGPTVKAAARSLARKPAFMATFALLLVGAVGLNAATSALRLHFRKLPVELQKELKTVPQNLGPWRQVNIDMPLQHDIQEVLGTEQYIFRSFVDTRAVPAARMAEFEGKDFKERGALLYRIQMEYPSAVINLSVTYYTGLVDTVAHIPDRCFVADGYRPTDYVFPHWKIPGLPVGAKGWRTADASKDEGLPVRYINFEDQDNSRRLVPKNVAYFFQVNGRYDSNPLGVRTTLQDLFEKHGYYAKVELLTQLPDQNKSAAVMQDFLASAMPELEKCLPDWSKVTAGGTGGGTTASAAVNATPQRSK